MYQNIEKTQVVETVCAVLAVIMHHADSGTIHRTCIRPRFELLTLHLHPRLRPRALKASHPKIRALRSPVGGTADEIK